METQFVFPTPDGYLYGMVHEPGNGMTVKSNILICQPLGYEWSNAYLPVIRLGRSLARAGHRVFRFDYAGTGDSAGLLTERQAPDLSNDIRTLLSYIHDHYPAGPVAIIAFRAAALFICPLLEEPSIGRVYLVDPVLEPGKYIKEITITDRSFSEALLASLVRAEPGWERLQHQKIVKVVFSKRGLLSNTRTKRLCGAAWLQNILEIDHQLDAFWNKHSVEGCAVLESKFSNWLQ